MNGIFLKVIWTTVSWPNPLYTCHCICKLYTLTKIYSWATLICWQLYFISNKQYDLWHDLFNFLHGCTTCKGRITTPLFNHANTCAWGHGKIPSLQRLNTSFHTSIHVNSIPRTAIIQDSVILCIIMSNVLIASNTSGPKPNDQEHTLRSSNQCPR